MIVNKSMFPVDTGFSAITKMNQRMSTLQVQLATGQKAGSLAEMGTSRPLSYSVRARQAALEGYGNTIDMVKLRLSVLDSAVSRLDSIEAETRTSTTVGNYGTSDVNLGTTPGLSRARLDEVTTLLNSDVDGRYLFSGSSTQTKPLPSVSTLLDGDGTRAGFKVVVAERKAADLGTTELGRLTHATSGAIVSLAEDGTHPFGLKLSTLSTTSSAVALTAPAGSPPSASVEFTGQPIAGETVTMAFKLPDGSSESISLKAVSGAAKEGEFTVGTTPDATAAAFETALDGSLKTLAKTNLHVASAFAAADMFFPGQGETAKRVAGPPYDSATSLVAATASDTVQWYAGSSGGGTAARQSVTARIDDSTVVSYGVEGNESGPTQLVRTLAVLAISSFPSADPTAHARYDAVATRQMLRVGENHNPEQGSIEMIGAELGMAQSTAEQTGDRHTTYGTQMDNLLADVEQVSKEDVAMEMLSLQTRLQASYQITASVAQLSLVNYIR